MPSNNSISPLNRLEPCEAYRAASRITEGEGVFSSSFISPLLLMLRGSYLPRLPPVIPGIVLNSQPTDNNITNRVFTKIYFLLWKRKIFK